MPSATDVWWQSSRLGRTAIKTLDTKLKMATASIAPISENQRARVARGVQLSPLKPFQPAPHTTTREGEGGEAQDAGQEGELGGSGDLHRGHCHDDGTEQGVEGGLNAQQGDDEQGYDSIEQQGSSKGVPQDAEAKDKRRSPCPGEEMQLQMQPGNLSNYV